MPTQHNDVMITSSYAVVEGFQMKIRAEIPSRTGDLSFQLFYFFLRLYCIIIPCNIIILNFALCLKLQNFDC